MAYDAAKPDVRPACPHFSSGPTAKRPGFSLDQLSDFAQGRSHRSALAKAKLKDAIDRTKAILNLPKDYRVAIVPASDTGAVEMAMWSMLGCRATDIFAWESFGKDWVTDAVNELKLVDCNIHVGDYGVLPPFEKARDDADIIFTWNGTTSGVRLPDGSGIPGTRAGLTICDATSAAFAQDLRDVPWAEPHDVSVHEAVVAVTDAEDLGAGRRPQEGGGPNRRIHARRIPAAGQNREPHGGKTVLLCEQKKGGERRRMDAEVGSGQAHCRYGAVSPLCPT